MPPSKIQTEMQTEMQTKAQTERQAEILETLGLAPIWVRRDDIAAPFSHPNTVTQAAALPLPASEAKTNDAGETNKAAEIAPPVSMAFTDAEAQLTCEPSALVGAPINTSINSPLDVPATLSSTTPIAELDWGTLKERVRHCTRCKLCETRTQTVFGIGDEQADWMLIGEAPGANEDRQGEPFVGQAGKLLDNMLRSVGRARGRGVYIANVIKCRPPGNRDPQPEEIAKCEPYLQRQLALVRPKLILALGRFAAQSLLKTQSSIASLRSRVHQYEGVPVIITYHPAYLLRNMPDKAKAWADLCFAQRTYQELIA